MIIQRYIIQLFSEPSLKFDHGSSREGKASSPKKNILRSRYLYAHCPPYKPYLVFAGGTGYLTLRCAREQRPIQPNTSSLRGSYDGLVMSSGFPLTAFHDEYCTVNFCMESVHWVLRRSASRTTSKQFWKKAVFHLLRLRFQRETESDEKRYARLASTTYCSP